MDGIFVIIPQFAIFQIFKLIFVFRVAIELKKPVCKNFGVSGIQIYHYTRYFAIKLLEQNIILCMYFDCNLTLLRLIV